MTADILPLTPEEIPALLEMIRELAEFEKLEHEMQATAESLHESFFGPRAVAAVLMARCEGKPAGYAIYFFTFSSFVGRRGIWLEDLYVRPDFRRHGLGRKLIEAVAAIGRENHCGRFEWTALNWNDRALNFYRGLGARVRSEWVLLRMDASGLQRLGTGPER